MRHFVDEGADPISPRGYDGDVLVRATSIVQAGKDRIEFHSSGGDADRPAM